MLTMENVTKRYKHRRSDVYALQDANVEIGTGEFVSIVGPSGSGKSTLLLMLGGMLSPSSGKVTLQGTSLYDLSPNERARMRKQHVGFVFQSFNLVPYLTALENVMIPLFLSGAAKEVQESRAKDLLERVGLGERLDHKPTELSIGQQQRVALARMLANDPQLILADEPTGNLDPDTSAMILDFFEQFVSEGRTIVMVTHDPRAAERARRKLRIDGGRIVEDKQDIKTRVVA